MNKKIGILCGSLRQDSYNRILAEKVAELLPAGYEAKVLEIADLPLYNEDLETEGQVPAEWIRFRREAAAQDGFILATPEYNRSIAPALKNALDVGSRPYGASIWAKKPALVMSASLGAVGGAIANHILRQSLVFLDMPVVQQPELYIGGVQKYITDGEVSSEDTLTLLRTAADALADLVERYS